MDRTLLAPRWLIAHAVVLSLLVAFISLGFWQLDRLEQRRLENEVSAGRYSTPSVELAGLMAEAEGSWEGIQFRRALMTGVFDASEEVLIRSQVHLGMAGFHVITPLVGESGETVLVNRGWVPLSAGDVQITEALPPPDEITVEGWVQLTQIRPPLGRTEPAGTLAILNRVDIDRIQQQSDHQLAPVYLVEIADRTDSLPIPLAQPVIDDQGPHLGYAIQWFGFAVVLVVGYFFLVRRRLNRGMSTR